jgi:signal transduction histidine kinase
MRPSPPKRLSAKLLLAILPPVLIAVCAIVWLQYYMARREILSAINKETLSLSQRIATNIDDLLEQHLRDLLTLSETPQIRDYYHNIDFGLLDEAETYRKELERYFKHFAERNRVYAQIRYLDGAGREVSRYPARPGAVREAEFTKAKEAGPDGWWTSPVSELADVGLVVYYAKAVYDEHKTFKGVLILCYDLAQVRELMHGVVVGQRGRAFVQAEGGLRIEGGALPTGNLELLTAPSGLRNRPWTVIVEAPMEDFLGPLRTVRNAALLTSLLGLAGLIVLLRLLVRSITRPIAALVSAAGKIGAGDFSHRIEVAEADELGTLSSAFNEMGGRLEQNRKQNAELQSQLIQAEKLSAVGQLISAVAHELNNPLAAISGYVQIALHDAGAPQLREDLNHVYSNVLRCRKVVENLLFFVRKSRHERKRVELNETVTSALELLEYRLVKTEDVRVALELAEPSPVVIGDFQQIVQVLINLINNACDAMEETTRYPEGKTLRISTGTREGRAFLRIEDNGPGVPPELESKLFAAFFTTKEPGRGTGLGLSICRHILQEHDGDISLENRPGQGCGFILDFPLGAEAELARLAQLEIAQEAAGYAAVPGKRVLIIDDEKDIADLVARLMREDGDEVTVVYDCSEALAHIDTDGFDLVISDMEMEHAKGSDIYARVAAVKARAKILFMTGDILNPKVLDFLSRTNSEYLVKPFDIEDMRQAARRLLAPRV